MDNDRPKVRADHARSDLLDLIDGILHGDLRLLEAFTLGPVASAVNEAAEHLHAARDMLADKRRRNDIDLYEIQACHDAGDRP